MSRIRTIKPSFWKHPVMGRLDGDTKCLAVALLNHADDEGYFRADLHLIRAELIPFEDDLVKIHGMITELSNVGWIELKNHEIQGPIGFIPTFSEHQKVNHAYPSKIKEYWDVADSVNNHGIDNERSPLERKGKERNNNTARARKTYPEDFENFRAVYPGHRLGGKGQDFKSWKAAKRSGMTVDVAYEYLGYWVKSKKWQEDDGKFVVAMSRWLRDGYWETMPKDISQQSSTPDSLGPYPDLDKTGGL